MKIAVIADVHLSRYGQDRIEESTNLPERLHSIKNILFEVAEYCLANEVKEVVIAGDLFHSKSVIYAIAQQLMLDYFKHYKDLHFTVIDGNHDLDRKGENAISSLRALEEVENVQWITRTPLYEPNYGILFVPHAYDMVKIVKGNSARILISHFGLNEGMLNSGISIIADISLRDLIGKYELVILGHYHKPQEIIRSDIKLYYVGSPLQLDWGEKGDEKRFLVVDTDTLDVKSIPTTSYRKYIELEVTSENKAELFKLAKSEKNSGNHVKIIKKEAVDLGDVNGDFRIVDKTDQDITNRGVTSSMSQAEKNKKYLEIKEIPDKDIPEYEKVGLEIIESCEGE